MMSVCSCFAFGVVVSDAQLCAAVGEFIAKFPQGEKIIVDEPLRYPGDALEMLCLSAIENETGVRLAITTDCRNSKSAPMDWFIYIEDSALNKERLAQCVDAESDTLHAAVQPGHRQAIALFQQKTGLAKKWSWRNFGWIEFFVDQR